MKSNISVPCSILYPCHESFFFLSTGTKELASVSSNMMPICEGSHNGWANTAPNRDVTVRTNIHTISGIRIDLQSVVGVLPDHCAPRATCHESKCFQNVRIIIETKSDTSAEKLNSIYMHTIFLKFLGFLTKKIKCELWTDNVYYAVKIHLWKNKIINMDRFCIILISSIPIMHDNLHNSHPIMQIKHDYLSPKHTLTQISFVLLGVCGEDCRN